MKKVAIPNSAYKEPCKGERSIGNFIKMNSTCSCLRIIKIKVKNFGKTSGTTRVPPLVQRVGK